MKFILKYNSILLAILFLASCSGSDNIDEEKPSITIAYDNGFPQTCEQLEKGKTYTFKAMVTDNVALSSYSLDIHNNFDHHTHDDQGEVCNIDEIKTAINPFIFIENYSIEGEVTSYEININITIPNDIDTGDYHCSYSVTDITGWQSRTSIDIKIID